MSADNGSEHTDIGPASADELAILDRSAKAVKDILEGQLPDPLPEPGDVCTWGTHVRLLCDLVSILAIYLQLEGLDAAKREVLKAWDAWKGDYPALQLLVEGPALQPYTLRELMHRTFDPRRWAVKSLFPEGLTILAGQPGLGKSYFALNMALAVAAGGKAFGALEVEQGDVLYLSLEDDPQGLQERVDAIWEDDEHDVPSNLYVQHEEVPKLGTGLIESLTTWLLHHPTARLILIDILADIRPPRKANGDWYLEDKALLSPLRALAHRFHVAIVLLHHTNRLSNPENPFEMIHGGAGIEGTPDVKAVLLRGVGQSDAILAIRGRSVREQKAAFRYAEGLWTYLGDGEDFERSQERQDILTYLRATPDAVTPKHVAIMLGRPEGPTRKLIRAMARHGEVKRVAYGLYTVFRDPPLLAESPPTIGNSGNSEHSGNSGNSGNSTENSMAYDSADGGGSDDSPPAADARVTRVTVGENTGNSSNELISQEKTSEISQELPELPESLEVGLGYDRGGERARPSPNGRGSPPAPGNRRPRGKKRGGWTWPDPDDRRRGREP